MPKTLKASLYWVVKHGMVIAANRSEIQGNKGGGLIPLGLSFVSIRFISPLFDLGNSLLLFFGCCLEQSGA